MVILRHHAGKVDDAEELDKIVGWVEFRILQKVQCIQLQFPVEILDRVIDSVQMLVQIRYLERTWPYVELTLVFV